MVLLAAAAKPLRTYYGLLIANDYQTPGQWLAFVTPGVLDSKSTREPQTDRSDRVAAANTQIVVNSENPISIDASPPSRHH